MNVHSVNAPAPGQIWIALIRGINVGGKNLLPMKLLVSILTELGCRDVKTYIQSGNAVFRSTKFNAAAFAESLSRAIESKQGFRPQVMLLTLANVAHAIGANPFPEAEDEPKSLHLLFLADTADTPDLNGLEKLRADSERFKLIHKVFYLHAPGGIGRSKLAAKAERLLGVPLTARYWSSILKIVEMARSIE